MERPQRPNRKNESDEAAKAAEITPKSSLSVGRLRSHMHERKNQRKMRSLSKK